MIFFTESQKISVMAAITSMQNNKAGNRVGQAVDDGKLIITKATRIPIEWESDSSDSESEEHAPGGGSTPAQVLTVQKDNDEDHQYDSDETDFQEQLAKIRKEAEQKEKALLAAHTSRAKKTTALQQSTNEDLDFGPYQYILEMFSYNLKKELCKTPFFIRSSQTDQFTMQDIIQDAYDLYQEICGKLNDQLDELHYAGSGSGEGDLALRKQYIQGAQRTLRNRLRKMLQSKHLTQLMIDWNKSIKDVVAKKEEAKDLADSMMNSKSRGSDPDLVHESDVENARTSAFNLLQQQQETDASELKCTRICNEFKTGKPCTHPNCTFAHSLSQFKPKRCVFAECGCNKEHKGCEFAHITQRIRKDGKCTFIYETALEIADRLKLVKELPMYPEKKDKAQETDKDTDKESNSSFKISDEEFTAQHALLPSESRPVVQKTEFFGDSDDEDWWKPDDKAEEKKDDNMEFPSLTSGVSMQATTPTVAPLSANDLEKMKQENDLKIRQAQQAIEKQKMIGQLAQQTAQQTAQQSIFTDPAIVNTPKPMQQPTDQSSLPVECSVQQAIQLIELMQKSGVQNTRLNLKII